MTRKRWFKLGAFVVAAIWSFRTVGPNSGGTLSRETTYITAPLAEDGLPNYALALLEDEIASTPALRHVVLVGGPDDVLESTVGYSAVAWHRLEAHDVVPPEPNRIDLDIAAGRSKAPVTASK